MPISRRDFLKFSALVTASAAIKPALKMLPGRLSTNPEAKNVLIFVFDTLSGTNMNFLGYPRETMPNLSHLLKRATVYHNHYASSNFTTPGTASLLTGREVWEHLALRLPDTVKADFPTRNIFAFFDDYYKIGYTHNYYADILLRQFQSAIDQHEFFLSQYLQFQQNATIPWFDSVFRNDYDTALVFKSRLDDSKPDEYPYTLLFPDLLSGKPYQPPEDLLAKFPLGLPVPTSNRQTPFILETAIDWCAQTVTELPQPFLGYFHFLPPHFPYNTREDFVGAFLDDGNIPLGKPEDPFALKSHSEPQNKEIRFRQEYDEYILYADAEFGRLFSMLEDQGILENTMVVLTTDHGEIIERGVLGHGLPYLFEPLVKSPLVIFEPGQTERRDIHALTSAIDLLPTLLRYTGHDLPPDLSGQVLPPFEGGFENPDRRVFALYNHKREFSHITTATLMMRTGKWKVIRYSGYQKLNDFAERAQFLNDSRIYPDPYFLVFNLDDDPEELDNLAEIATPEVQALIDELEQFFREQVEYPNINGA